MADTVKVASVWDMAIDAVSMAEGGLEYAKTRDPKILALVPGKEPTWFHIRRIPASVFPWVQDGETNFARQRRAFEMSVTRIDNLVTPDGTTVKSMGASERTRIGTSEVEHMSAADMALIPPAFIEDIGDWCYGRSFLPPGSGALYQPPPGSRTALVVRLAYEAQTARRALAPSANSHGAAATPSGSSSPSSDEPPASP